MAINSFTRNKDYFIVSLFLASEYYHQESQNAPRRQLHFTSDHGNDSRVPSTELPCGIMQRLQANMRKARYCLFNTAGSSSSQI